MVRGQILVSLRGRWGIRLEVVIENVRLNFGSEMRIEWRFGNDLHGTIGLDKLWVGDCVGSREKRAGQTRQGWC